MPEPFALSGNGRPTPRVWDLGPRLTIGIPHLDRSDMLQRAIDSCLAQTVPVHVVIADQGATEKTRLILDRYKDHPHVEHIITAGKVTCLWENWRASAEACRTPFFAWLQDDDILSRIYASRVTQAFDSYPEALHWQARCHCTPDGVHAVWWGTNGPQIGMRMLDTATEMWPGGLLVASMYLMSWALSPGVAFRCGPEFSAAIEGMPSDCNLFAERLILAAMGCQAPWVADPVIAGYWVHHGSNQSYLENADGSIARQRTIMVEHLDDLLDRFNDWRLHFYHWLRMRSPIEIVKWMEGWECGESRHSDALIQVMRESIMDRVEVVMGAAADDIPEPVVIYDDDAA